MKIINFEEIHKIYESEKGKFKGIESEDSDKCLY